MPISGIYKIQSLKKPERCYVGSSIDIHKRWMDHIADLKRGNHRSKKMQNHFNKFGQYDLVFSILIGCETEALLPTEQFFLDSLNPYFNTCKKAGNTLGIKFSDEAKKKLSEIKKGKPTWNKGLKLSDKHKENIGKSQQGEKNSFFNKKHTDETKEKIKEWNRLHPPTKESRDKWRETMRKKAEEKRKQELELSTKN